MKKRIKRLKDEKILVLETFWSETFLSETLGNIKASKKKKKNCFRGTLSNCAPTHSRPLQVTPTHFNPLQATPAYFNSLQATPTHSRPLQPTPGYSNPLQPTPGYSDHLQPTPGHSDQLKPL